MSRTLFLSASAGLSGDLLVSALVALGGDENIPQSVAEKLSLPIVIDWRESPRRRLVVQGGEEKEELHEIDLRLAATSLPLDVRIPAHQLLRLRAAALRERDIAFDTSFDIVSTLALWNSMNITEIIFPSPPVVGHSPAAEKLLPQHLRSQNGQIKQEMLTPTAAVLLRELPSSVDESWRDSGGKREIAATEVDGTFSSRGDTRPLEAALFG